MIYWVFKVYLRLLTSSKNMNNFFFQETIYISLGNIKKNIDNDFTIASI